MTEQTASPACISHTQVPCRNHVTPIYAVKDLKTRYLKGFRCQARFLIFDSSFLQTQPDIGLTDVLYILLENLKTAKAGFSLGSLSTRGAFALMSHPSFYGEAIQREPCGSRARLKGEADLPFRSAQRVRALFPPNGLSGLGAA